MKLELVIDTVVRPWRPEAEVLRIMEAHLEAIGPSDAGLLVIVSDDRTLQEHNREFRGKDRPTDVLSFSYLTNHESARHELLRGGSAGEYCDGGFDDESAPLAGQILISIDTVRARGAQHAEDVDGEIIFLATHGLLHVLGFDHESEVDAREMEAVEAELFEPLRRTLRARGESGVR